jgi:hypothetical protein
MADAVAGIGFVLVIQFSCGVPEAHVQQGQSCAL